MCGGGRVGDDSCRRESAMKGCQISGQRNKSISRAIKLILAIKSSH